MSDEEGLFPSNSDPQISNANFYDSIKDGAAPNPFGLTYPTYLLDQPLTRDCDNQLVQLGEYSFFNDPILNEDTYTLRDELLAQTTQPVPELSENGTSGTQMVGEVHPNHFSNSPSLSPPRSGDENNILEPVPSSLQQELSRILGKESHEQNEVFESIPFGVNDSELIHILERSGDQTSFGAAQVSDNLLPVNKNAQNSYVQEQFPLGKEECVVAVTNSPSSPVGVIPCPPCDFFYDGAQISPTGIGNTSLQGNAGNLSQDIPRNGLRGVVNVPIQTQIELRDQREMICGELDEKNDLIPLISDHHEGTEEGDLNFLKEGINEKELPIRSETGTEKVPEDEENVEHNQEEMWNIASVRLAQPNLENMTSAEKIRMIFLYPMCKQMRTFEKRCENSRRALRQRSNSGAKYYALKRIRQDVKENLEIAQKAVIVARQLQLERKRLTNTIAKEKCVTRRLRGLVDKLAFENRP